MKTIRCNLTKEFRIFANTSLKISRNFACSSKNYALFSITGMFEALSLLVYTHDPHSKGYNSISILYFSLGVVPVKR